MNAKEASEYLIHLVIEDIIICRPCKYSLHPNSIEKHFDRTHTVSPQARVALVIRLATNCWDSSRSLGKFLQEREGVAATCFVALAAEAGARIAAIFNSENPITLFHVI